MPRLRVSNPAPTPIAMKNSSKVWGTQYEFPALNDGYVVKAELADGTMASGQSFVFNLRKEKFQDIRVREAIGLMFNFEWSNDVLFYGLYARINSFAGKFIPCRRRHADG